MKFDGWDGKIRVERMGDDYVAIRDFGDDLGWLLEIGQGATEEEARADLLQQIDE